MGKISVTTRKDSKNNHDKGVKARGTGKKGIKHTSNEIKKGKINENTTINHTNENEQHILREGNNNATEEVTSMRTNEEITNQNTEEVSDMEIMQDDIIRQISQNEMERGEASNHGNNDYLENEQSDIEGEYTNDDEVNITQIGGDLNETALVDAALCMNGKYTGNETNKNGIMEEVKISYEEKTSRPSRFDGEDALDPILTEQEWSELNDDFKNTDMMIHYTMEDDVVELEGAQWSLHEFRAHIIENARKEGIIFQNDTLLLGGGNGKQFLTGRTLENNRALWCYLNRGYIYIKNITIWVAPAFCGRLSTNLSIVELEYQNINTISVTELKRAMSRWGAIDILIISHMWNEPNKKRLPSIACVKDYTRTNPNMHAFRIAFTSPEATNKVYANYLKERNNGDTHKPHNIRSMILKPVTNVRWDIYTEKFYRPRATEQIERQKRMAVICGTSYETSEQEITRTLKDLGYEATITPNTARTMMAELKNEEQAQKLVNMYGYHSVLRIQIGNIRLFTKEVEPAGQIKCFQCQQLGHFKRECPQLREGTNVKNPWDKNAGRIEKNHQNQPNTYKNKYNNTWKSSGAIVPSMQTDGRDAVHNEKQVMVINQTPQIQELIRSGIAEYARSIERRFGQHSESINRIETIVEEQRLRQDEQATILQEQKKQINEQNKKLEEQAEIMKQQTGKLDENSSLLRLVLEKLEGIASKNFQ